MDASRIVITKEQLAEGYKVRLPGGGVSRRRWRLLKERGDGTYEVSIPPSMSREAFGPPRPGRELAEGP